MTPASPEQFKDAVRQAWDASASGWNQQTPAIRNWLAAPTATLLDEAQIGPGMRVLDIAAGAGDQTLDIARRVGEGGRVLATDISPAILQFASENARGAGLPQVQTQVCDAEDLLPGETGFDAAVCRLGLMLCPNPLGALRQMHRVLRPGGHAAVLVFSEPQRNPCIGILMTTACRHAGLAPRDPLTPGGLLSLGKPGLLQDYFSQAGFTDVATERMQAPFQLPSARDYLHFVRTSASPIVQILGHLNPEAREAAWADMEEQLEVFQLPEGWEGPNELLLAHGMRPLG
ncbi:methyltransferase domain-containing protein [Polaromonas sp.]|uniref:class I SAM-dependent methyltransferase n=1 Tax=Polaromonas sp. TaxID=1869339 RepID=UPI0013B84AF3|nr:methyltransferase domain-containing protein [Polaromonas sp.]NDP64689.1 methyltransferase domain-containing protein [Polaromonas sp.]